MALRWTYRDTCGVTREGTFEKFLDYGGSDITYFFRREEGTLDLVSGSRLSEAKPKPRRSDEL